MTITREEIKTSRSRPRSSARTPGSACHPVPGTHGGRLLRKVEEVYKPRSRAWKGLVLDLRNDPGGLLDALMAVSAAFLPGRT